MYWDDVINKKTHKKCFSFYFWWRHHKKDPFLNDVITKTLKFWWRHYKTLKFWWRHNDKLRPLISHLPWPFKNWKFGNYLLTPCTFKPFNHLPFQKLKFVTRHGIRKHRTGGKNIRCRIEKFYALNKKLINFIF